MNSFYYFLFFFLPIENVFLLPFKFNFYLCRGKQKVKLEYKVYNKKQLCLPLSGSYAQRGTDWRLSFCTGHWTGDPNLDTSPF